LHLIRSIPHEWHGGRSGSPQETLPGNSDPGILQLQLESLKLLLRLRQR